MRIILDLVPWLLLVAVLGWSSCARRRAHHSLGALQIRWQAAVQEGEEHLRLLRAAGIGVRNQGMALLGQSELCVRKDAVEWAAIAGRLMELADDMQDHASPSPESRILAPELIDVGVLMAQCVEMVTSTLRPSQRLWRLAPELANYPLYVDHRALALVLLRVLSNAARATRHLDWIEISVEITADSVILIVQDEGSGLLVPTSTQTRDTRGLSLGLATARSLVEAHGGRLDFESVPGVGTRVEITLPKQTSVCDELIPGARHAA
jgi:signal transduction histidine kinase